MTDPSSTGADLVGYIHLADVLETDLASHETSR